MISKFDPATGRRAEPDQVVAGIGDVRFLQDNRMR
jgi:hypothetical protein